jgi:archaemetzincin
MEDRREEPVFLEPVVSVCPLGDATAVDVRVVAANVQAVFDLGVDILERSPLPEEAFLADRRQYDAAAVLRHLDAMVRPPFRKILGVTTVDLCIPVFTHVFGEAHLGGRAAVVSSFRLRTNENGFKASIETYTHRLIKVALHELAHTRNLVHCDNPRCLMHFSPKVSHLDRLPILFCERCHYLLTQDRRRPAGME